MKLKLTVIVVAIAAALPCAAKSNDPSGILAASIGDSVVLLNAVTGQIATLETGPVGWLFPAPGGMLFAPDVIGNRTSVINLRNQKVVETMAGLTMPNFGVRHDRYATIVGGDVLIMSYPERAVMASIDAEIGNPWQTVYAPEDSAILVLERIPDGSTGVYLTTVNLITRQTVFRQPLGGDIRHIAVSGSLGLLAFADHQAGAVHLVQPTTLNPVAARRTPGRPIDVVFAHGGSILATAVATETNSGLLDLAQFKKSKKGLRVAKETTIDLRSAPARLAPSPDGEHVAVAGVDGSVTIVRVGKREIVTTYALPGEPRDLRWCDPSAEGPILPEWSDGEAEEGGYDPYVPRVGNGSAVGSHRP